MDKGNQVLSANGVKRKKCNASESRNSNLSKQSKGSRNDVEDVTVLKNVSSSVTPAVLRSKSANRSILPEIVSRKLSLRSATKTREK